MSSKLSILIMGGFLLGCSSTTHHNAYWNEQLASDGHIVWEVTGESDGLPPEEGRKYSAVHLASLNVPWWINSKCRSEFKWSNYEAQYGLSVDPSVRKRNPVAQYCEDEVEKDRSKDHDSIFFGVALSGGGARAALFSAAVLKELGQREANARHTEQVKLVEHVDVISAASGGAMTAALFAISCDSDDNTCEDNVAKAEDGIINDAVLLRDTKNRPDWDGEVRKPVDDGVIKIDGKVEQYSKNAVFEMLSRDYFLRWFGNRLWPDNLFSRYFTGYDLTDIFAETLSDNLFDTSHLGGLPFRMKDINPRRPNLIINATDFTYEEKLNTEYEDNNNNSCNFEIDNQNSKNDDFSNFTFTVEGFESLNSKLDSFEISRAVAASSAYPAAFNYSTLAKWNERRDGDHSCRPNSFKHLFDAGASDNLAIESLWNSVKESLPPNENGIRSRKDPPRVLILIVDAQNGFFGRSSDKPNPRGFFDYIVDTNFMDAYDTLMKGRYKDTLRSVEQNLEILKKENSIEDYEIVHLPLLAFSKSKIWKGYDGQSGYEWRKMDNKSVKDRRRLWKKIKRIGTGYGLSIPEQNTLDDAAKLLVDNSYENIRSYFD